MIRNNKLLSSSLILISLLGITSCQHQHTYDTSKWVHENNAEYHWHNANCKHDGEISDVTPHNMIDEVDVPTVAEQIETKVSTCKDCGYTSSIQSETWDNEIVSIFKGTRSYQNAPNFEANLKIITKETKKVVYEEDENEGSSAPVEAPENSDSSSAVEDYVEKEFITVEEFSVVRNEKNFYQHTVKDGVASELWVSLDYQEGKNWPSSSSHKLNYIEDGEQKTENIKNGDFKKYAIYDHSFNYLAFIVELDFKQRFYDQSKLDGNGNPTLTYIPLYTAYEYNAESNAYEINLDSCIISKTGMREELVDLQFKAYFLNNKLTSISVSYVDTEDYEKNIERTVELSINFNVADEVVQFVPYTFD